MAYEISHNFFPNGSKHIHYMDSQCTIRKANEKNDLAYHIKAHVKEEDNNCQDMGNFFVDRLCKYCKKEKDHMIIIEKIKSDMKNKTKMETISSLQFPN
jgi:recombinational DNA repair protein RecR